MIVGRRFHVLTRGWQNWRFFADRPGEVECDIVGLGCLFLFSCYRADGVTAFAGNFYLVLPSIPARVATVFFTGSHHTVAWNVRTGALLRVVHQFLRLL